MFNLTQYTKAYVPFCTNSVREIAFLGKNNGYPIHIVDEHLTVTADGKNFPHDDNPIVFPYSQEWYDKLKLAYPNLKPYVADYRAVIKNILANSPMVVCKFSYIGFDKAITSDDIVTIHRNKILNDSLYYVPVNPYTLKPCNSDTDYYVLPDLYIPF